MRKLFFGVTAYFHDSSVAVVENGQLVFACQEERWTRRKFDNAAPTNAFRAALHHLGANSGDIAALGYYENPEKKIERIKATHPQEELLVAHCDHWDRLRSPVALLKSEMGFGNHITVLDHHLCHAAYTYFSSGYARSLVVVVDGVGEWDSVSIWNAANGKLKKLSSARFPNSAGLFFAAMTAFLGMRPNSDEYKVMGMAPYGNAIYHQALGLLLSTLDGQISMDASKIDVFDMRNTGGIERLLGVSARVPGEAVAQVHYDIAASAQAVLEDCLVSLCKYYGSNTRHSNLCLAGGVALNCVANSKVLLNAGFTKVWVPPAADDPGNAVGAAYLLSLREGIKPKPIEHAFLGPCFGAVETELYLKAIGAKFVRLDDDEMFSQVARLLSEGMVVGWCRGRAEFGARALGNRSILADARHPGIRDRVNIQIKKREIFRPFAPICLADRALEFFEEARGDHSYMTFISKVVAGKNLPAITHVDGTARLQTIDRGSSEAIAQLLVAFEALTNTPVLLNTSFNLAEEPIVLTSMDAFNTFRESELDAVVLGGVLVIRSEQPSGLLQSGTFEMRQLSRSLSPLSHHTYFFA